MNCTPIWLYMVITYIKKMYHQNKKVVTPTLRQALSAYRLKYKKSTATEALEKCFISFIIQDPSRTRQFYKNLINPMDKATVRKQIMQNKEC